MTYRHVLGRVAAVQRTLLAVVRVRVARLVGVRDYAGAGVFSCTHGERLSWVWMGKEEPSRAITLAFYVIRLLVLWPDRASACC